MGRVKCFLNVLCVGVQKTAGSVFRFGLPLWRVGPGA